jgi:DNA-directed RNA polymerase subunit RPC12/RpoP
MSKANDPPRSDFRRGYTGAGDYIELGAACLGCGRTVEPPDIDLDAERLSIVCPGCHKVVIRLDLPEFERPGNP